jgi:hypothetical protein
MFPSLSKVIDQNVLAKAKVETATEGFKKGICEQNSVEKVKETKTTFRKITILSTLQASIFEC